MKNIEEIEGKVFFTCTACMSVWADSLSWANANRKRVTVNPEDADNIVVLSCQVTDLAILNDLRTIERYKEKCPDKRYFISGCLAKREDVDLPEWIERLECPRKNYQHLDDKKLVHFEKPFWVKNFEENEEEFEQGHLFRGMYPLRIGKGCPFKCTYCTIRVTRGKFEQYHAKKLKEEFLAFENILLVADSPMVYQIKDWYTLALKHNKGFSIRNVEPSIVVQCRDEFLDLAERGLLKVFHSPIQSNNVDVLRDINRHVEDTLETIKIARQLKAKGVFIATNIIIDYKDFEQGFRDIYDLYDYISWNPLWDNKWNRKRAEERFEKYITNEVEIK